ncbi:winged helix-turn-helix domain-containing protein [Halobaculum sp. MBLA0147]|uniref:winged helix-turn-helix domain-containing protein n=1 Tax=Halobaculum sp. MBLA0147 TaxID=3079934 RepID=UPI003526B521
MADPAVVERSDPDEVFGLLSDDSRVAILRALWEADGHEATFSELRDAVVMRDSGQFNYHLGKLVGQFVTNTEDAYELTQAGIQINGAIEAGAYTAAGSLEPVTLTDPCPTCGGDRTLEYDDETVRISCQSCPVEYRIGVPPAVFAGHSRDEIPRVADRYLRTTFHHITNGFCSFCDGPVAPTVEVEEPPAPDGDVPSDESAADAGDDSAQPSTVLLAQYTCQQCGSDLTIGLPQVFLHHPAVVSFYYDHGVDVRDRPVWEFNLTDPDYQTVRGRDPFRVGVTYECGEETLTLVVDETLNVVAIEE